MTGYECTLHKKTYSGIQRPDFNRLFYDAILSAPMHLSMMFYKEVKFNCHCPENYQKFDELVETIRITATVNITDSSKESASPTE
jgi:hypothetical protein